MKFSIAFAHFVTGKMSAYTVAQFLKHKGSHEIEIIVVNNSYPDDSIKYLEPFKDQIKIIDNTTDLIRTHGTALDIACEAATHDWIVCAESDSFPTLNTWLDYYEKLIEDGYDCMGSMLSLSGGTFMHPTGMCFKKSLYFEAKKFVQDIDYTYFPNMSMREGFPCHVMIPTKMVQEALEYPKSVGIDYHHSYVGLSIPEILDKAKKYSPICGVFHCGMGASDERLTTYGKRNATTDYKDVFVTGEAIIHRMGMEPGQFFSNWCVAHNKHLFFIPTEVVWMPNRVNQQQQFTITQNGFRHLWAITAYNGCEVPELKDIIDYKAKCLEELYNSLPENQKI